MSGLRFPRRHDSSERDLSNAFRARPYILVREQAERRALAGTMTDGAVLEDHRSDITRKGEPLLSRDATCDQTKGGKRYRNPYRMIHLNGSGLAVRLHGLITLNP